jgi:hypothetical protein
VVEQVEVVQPVDVSVMVDRQAATGAAGLHE